MKKLVFMLITALSVVLTSCSWFASKPIEPKVIGTGNVQYEAKDGTWFVVIDSTQYTITNVTIFDRNSPSHSNMQNIAPVDGMLVTVFTAPHMKGVQAVTGKQSVAEIEEQYHTNGTGIVIAFGIFLLCIFASARLRTKKVSVVNADV